MKARRIFIPAAFVVGGLAFAAVIALLFGLILMALWNWLMPEIFGLPAISYWQAWGLVLLAHILFKGGHAEHRRWRPGSRDKWEDRFKERFKHRFSGHTDDAPIEDANGDV